MKAWDPNAWWVFPDSVMTSCRPLWPGWPLMLTRSSSSWISPRASLPCSRRPSTWRRCYFSRSLVTNPQSGGRAWTLGNSGWRAPRDVVTWRWACGTCCRCPDCRQSSTSLQIGACVLCSCSSCFHAWWSDDRDGNNFPFLLHLPSYHLLCRSSSMIPRGSETWWKASGQNGQGVWCGRDSRCVALWLWTCAGTVTCGSRLGAVAVVSQTGLKDWREGGCSCCRRGGRRRRRLRQQRQPGRWRRLWWRRSRPVWLNHSTVSCSAF